MAAHRRFSLSPIEVMERSPRVSVILPAYNAARYLDEALRSTLSQTFVDFECLVIDDGSRDGTSRLIQRRAQRDSRVREIRTPHGGIVEALNTGLNEARGDLIARMDADDVCLPHRFAQQVKFLDEHPEDVAVGSGVLLIDPYGSELNEILPACEHEQIEANLLEANGWAMFHPSVMMRRQAVLSIGGYRREYQWSEDIDLFLRLAEIGRLANLPSVLLKYRQHFSSVNRTRRQLQMSINRRLLRETYQRRGQEMPGHVPVEYPTMGPFELARAWGWQALTNHNYAAARRHALRALKAGPLRYHAWTLAYRSIFPGQRGPKRDRDQSRPRPSAHHAASEPPGQVSQVAAAREL